MAPDTDSRDSSHPARGFTLFHRALGTGLLFILILVIAFSLVVMDVNQMLERIDSQHGFIQSQNQAIARQNELVEQQREKLELQKLTQQAYGQYAQALYWRLNAVASLDDQALELDLCFALDHAREFGLTLDAGSGEEIHLGYHTNRRELYLDRRRAGKDLHPDFPGIHRAEVEPIEGQVQLKIIIDNCALEVFAQDGRTTMSDMIFPHNNHYGLYLYSQGGTTYLTEGRAHTLSRTGNQNQQSSSPKGV